MNEVIKTTVTTHRTNNLTKIILIYKVNKVKIRTITVDELLLWVFCIFFGIIKK